MNTNKGGEAKSLRRILLIYMIKHPIRYIRIRRIAKQIVIKNKEILDMLGSDYDANGKPYWDYHKLNCACTKCMPKFDINDTYDILTEL